MSAQAPARSGPRFSQVLCGLALAALVLLYAMGAFDVFLASNGLPLPVYHCVRWGNAFTSTWYCDGPWSTAPYPPDVAAAVASRQQPDQ